MNNMLFGIIGVLMFAITSLGVAEVRLQAHAADLKVGIPDTVESAEEVQSGVDVVAQAPASTVTGNIVQAKEKAAAAYTNDWRDDDEEEDFDEDEDDRPSVARAPVTSAPAPATKPTQTQTSQAANTYTLAQVASHNSAASCYSAINGSVYDLTSFVSRHPGGAAAIKSLCGVDGTAAYNNQHGGSGRPASELASLRIGSLAN